MRVRARGRGGRRLLIVHRANVRDELPDLIFGNLAAPGRHSVGPALYDRVEDDWPARRRKSICLLISGGPMPPPPLAWQPEQLYQSNSR